MWVFLGEERRLLFLLENASALASSLSLQADICVQMVSNIIAWKSLLRKDCINIEKQNLPAY